MTDYDLKAQNCDGTSDRQWNGSKGNRTNKKPDRTKRETRTDVWTRRKEGHTHLTVPRCLCVFSERGEKKKRKKSIPKKDKLDSTSS